MSFSSKSDVFPSLTSLTVPWSAPSINAVRGRKSKMEPAMSYWSTINDFRTISRTCIFLIYTMTPDIVIKAQSLKRDHALNWFIVPRLPCDSQHFASSSTHGSYFLPKPWMDTIPVTWHRAYRTGCLLLYATSWNPAMMRSDCIFLTVLPYKQVRAQHVSLHWCQLSELVSMDNLPFDLWKENHPSRRSFFRAPLFTLKPVN